MKMKYRYHAEWISSQSWWQAPRVLREEPMKQVRTTLQLALVALSLSFGMVGCSQPTSTVPATSTTAPLPFTALDTLQFHVQLSATKARAVAQAIVVDVCTRRIFWPCINQGNTVLKCGNRRAICIKFVTDGLRRRGYDI
jgi:hypothetical protein